MPGTDKLVEVFSRLGARGFFLFSLFVLGTFILYPAFDLTFFQRGRIDQQVNVLERMAKIETGDEKFKSQLNSALSRTLALVEETPLSFRDIAGAIFHPNQDELDSWTKFFWGGIVLLVFGVLVGTFSSDAPSDKWPGVTLSLGGAALCAFVNFLIPTFYFYSANYLLFPLFSFLLIASLYYTNNKDEQAEENQKRSQALLDIQNKGNQNQQLLVNIRQSLLTPKGPPTHPPPFPIPKKPSE